MSSPGATGRGSASYGGLDCDVGGDLRPGDTSRGARSLLSWRWQAAPRDGCMSTHRAGVASSLSGSCTGCAPCVASNCCAWPPPRWSASTSPPGRPPSGCARGRGRSLTGAVGPARDHAGLLPQRLVGRKPAQGTGVGAGPSPASTGGAAFNWCCPSRCRPLLLARIWWQPTTLRTPTDLFPGESGTRRDLTFARASLVTATAVLTAGLGIRRR
jgi:hypothetical protein